MARSLALFGFTALLLCLPHGAGAQTSVNSGTTCPSTAVVPTGSNRQLYSMQSGALCVTEAGSAPGVAGAVFGPTAVGSAVVNPPVLNGFQDGSGNVAVVKPTVGLPVNVSQIGSTAAVQGSDNSLTINQSFTASHRNTYQAVGIGYTAYATPQDLVCVQGSASKTVGIMAFGLGLGSTTATLETLYWVKRSAANTGGASTSPALVSIDSAQPAATAVVYLYTSAPSAGALVGNLNIQTLSTGILTSAPPQTAISTTLSVSSNTTSSPNMLLLHGTAEEVCANWNGAALPTGFSAYYWIQLVEF